MSTKKAPPAGAPFAEPRLDGTGLEQQRSRPPPAAETGRRGWGRVLIFQGPVKGLRKNQQTQLVRAAHLSYSFCRNVYQESTTCRSTVCRTSVGRYRTGTMYVRAIRKKQRQGITMTAVSCLLCYMARLGAIAAQVRTGRACTHVRSETVKLHIYGWSFDCGYGILHLENQLRQI